MTSLRTKQQVDKVIRSLKKGDGGPSKEDKANCAGFVVRKDQASH